MYLDAHERREELLRVNRQIDAANDEVCAAETDIRSLEQTIETNGLEAGRLALREPYSGSQVTLSDIRDRTRSQLQAARRRYDQANTKRSRLQERRRELVSGRPVMA